MASPMIESNRLKADVGSYPCRKVRVVAKIRGFTDKESNSLSEDSTPSISVHKPNDGCGLSDKVAISFGDPTSRRDAYVDYCYEQNEDIDLIYSREIRPLISRVFDGQNSSIIAYGARGSGKTYTIQGSEEKPGLAVLAMAEILSIIEETGKSASISLFEVFQDHVHDLLDPNRPEVQVFGDSQGKVNLKGLSQVPVKSISEFQKLYFSGMGKPTQKVGLDPPRRSHKGLLIYIGHSDETSAKVVGQMNFVDLAGYVEAKRSNNDRIILAEVTRINKSLYALLDVVYALNSNESRVPYWESKLARMLRDSFGGTNRILMLTCLKPFVCHDTTYTMSLASWRCQGTNRVLTNSAKKTTLSAKPKMPSSLKKGKPVTFSSTVKKQTGTRVHFCDKKSDDTLTKRLFDEGNLSTSKQAMSQLDDILTGQSEIAPVPVPLLQEEEGTILNVSVDMAPREEEHLFSADSKNTKAPPLEKMFQDVSLQSDSHCFEITPAVGSAKKALALFGNGDDSIDKENKSLLINEGGSLFLSARLREISNNLKSICSSPSCIMRPDEFDATSSNQVTCNDILEPKTPVLEYNTNNKGEITKFSSPWNAFNEQTIGMKHSLVKESLEFLNSASKEELKRLRGIGEKRATYILELRERTPEPFKNLDDLQEIGLSAKQIKVMMQKVAGELFN